VEGKLMWTSKVPNWVVAPVVLVAIGVIVYLHTSDTGNHAPGKGPPAQPTRSPAPPPQDGFAWTNEEIVLDRGSRNGDDLTGFPGNRWDVMDLSGALNSHPRTRWVRLRWQTWRADGAATGPHTIEAVYDRQNDTILFKGYDLYMEGVSESRIHSAARHFRAAVPIARLSKPAESVFLELGRPAP
jgi:hypothetical protein